MTCFFCTSGLQHAVGSRDKRYKKGITLKWQASLYGLGPRSPCHSSRVSVLVRNPLEDANEETQQELCHACLSLARQLTFIGIRAGERFIVYWLFASTESAAVITLNRIVVTPYLDDLRSMLSVEGGL